MAGEWLELRLPRLVLLIRLLACLAKSLRNPARAFLLATNERFEARGTGNRFEEKWSHTAALRALAVLSYRHHSGRTEQIRATTTQPNTLGAPKGAPQYSKLFSSHIS